MLNSRTDGAELDHCKQGEVGDDHYLTPSPVAQKSTTIRRSLRLTQPPPPNAPQANPAVVG
jgi:hypothetical protein